MKLSSFDLNLLVALDALLSEESVSRAAERLRIGQPAMSAALGRLRTSLGDPLLVRSGRGLRKTMYAEALEEPLNEIMRKAEQLLNFGADFDPTASHRNFSIIASDYVGLVLLRQFFGQLGQVAPGVSVKVGPIDPNWLDPSWLDGLREGLIDLAVYPAELVPSNLPFHSEALFQDDFVVAVDADNSEVGDVMTVEQLRTLPYISASSGSLADQRLVDAQINLNTVMVAQSFVVAPFMLRGTRMFTIIQRRLAEAVATGTNVRLVESPIPIPAIHEVLIWSPRHGNDAGNLWLRNQMRETAALLS